MSDQSWLAPVLAALDVRAAAPLGHDIQPAGQRWQPAEWFFRDDDAGWADRALWQLTDLFAACDVTLEVAAIPAALSEATGRRLGQLAQDGVIRVYQHGKWHRNHERTGRRCEFGPGRWPAEQLADLASGRELLSARIGAAAEPVFVPPWNRCADLTLTLLDELGFAGLSRDLPGPRRHDNGLGETGVCLDWTRLWREGGPHRIGAALADTVLADTVLADTGRTAPGKQPIGVMLHHATLGPDELTALRALLTTVRDHLAVRLSSLAGLVTRARLNSEQPTGRTR